MLKDTVLLETLSNAADRNQHQEASDELDVESSLTDLTQPNKRAIDFIAEERSPFTELATGNIGFVPDEDSAPYVASMGRYPAPPPALDSPRLEAELRQVHELAVATLHDHEGLAKWHRPPGISWDEIARDLITRHQMEPAQATQVFELLHLAHHDALVLTARAKVDFLRPAPHELDRAIPPTAILEDISAYPSAHAAVAAASHDILLQFFPNERARIERHFSDHLTSRVAAGVSFPSDLSAGAEIGHHVGSEILTLAGCSSKR